MPIIIIIIKSSSSRLVYMLIIPQKVWHRDWQVVLPKFAS